MGRKSVGEKSYVSLFTLTGLVFIFYFLKRECGRQFWLFYSFSCDFFFLLASLTNFPSPFSFINIQVKEFIIFNC